MQVTQHELLSMVFGVSPVVAGYDCTGSNEHLAPAGSQLAGYDTGSGIVPWTKEQFARHPGSIHIDQDAAASDPTADVLDVELDAATLRDCPVWSKRAWADFGDAKRPGQRTPAIYCSASNVTPVVNALIGGGVTTGIGLWVANWNMSEPQAVQDVISASGPFPIIGVQYASGTWGDFDVWSHKWLSIVSGAPLATNPVRRLQQTHRGFSSVQLAWDSDPNANSYTVKTYWPATDGSLVSELVTSSPGIRVGHLHPGHTYLFRVRAHPGGSVGSDAEVKVTTR